MSQEEWFRYEDAKAKARLQQSNYYEKLVVLNAGTIALIVTGVLGPLRSKITHRYTLRCAIVCLMISIVLLLIRNLAATKYEKLLPAFDYQHLMGVQRPDRKKLSNAWRWQSKTEMLGCLFTVVAFLLLTGIAILLV